MNKIDQARALEETYLRIFKFMVLGVMSLALVATVATLIYAGFQFLQSPKAPAPVQPAPEKVIQLDDLKKFLIEQERQAQEREKPQPVQQTGKVPLLYQEQVTQLYRCSIEFARMVNAEIEQDDQQASRQIETLRGNLESVSSAPHRGEPFITSMVAFGCNALRDSALAALRRDGKVKSVVQPMIGFHIRAWDRIVAEKRKFEQGEAQRVTDEAAAEATRVVIAKTKAYVALTTAGGALATFVLLALYLLLSKIETNLREVARSAERLGEASAAAT